MGSTLFKIKIKPLSLNHAYRGRRFKTPELDNFKKELSYILPRIEVSKDKKLEVTYVFGVSSLNSDGDNLIKIFQDSIADQYGFNDKKIYRWFVEKIDVEKGEEFIEFKIDSYQEKYKLSTGKK